jgi:UDPglucose 6-dehydrogenase
MKVAKVSVVGLGKLGAPMVGCFAAKGHAVIGVDTNPEVVRLVNEGRTPVFEPGLAEVFVASRERIRATSSFEEAVAGSDLTFVLVPTPSDREGAFSLQYVKAAAEKVGEALAKKTGFHLVVLTSTVLPGASEHEVAPLLELRSGKTCSRDFGLCYNPEFIALGSVLRDMLNPDFILIGESDRRSGDLLEDFYRTVCDNKPPVARMNWVNAELTKLAVNTFVTTKISYANMLAEICERLPGADVGVVTGALGLDSRIGAKYLKGALGYGGPCFPRDNVAFSWMSRKLGREASLAEATDAVNRRQLDRLEEKILSHLPAGGTVAVLGLAYKPNTAVVERAQGTELVARLAKKGLKVAAYDPLAMEDARRATGDGVLFAASVRDCVRGASVVVIASPCEEFRAIDPADLSGGGVKAVLLDCWRLLSPEKYAASAEYVPWGSGGRQEEKLRGPGKERS